LSQQQLQEKIHTTFELVRQSIEAELHGKPDAQNVSRKTAVTHSQPQRVLQAQ